MSEIAVVILNFNGRTHLEAFLPSVIQNSHNVDIYVVDNGSTDDSLDFIRTTFPDILIIELKKNKGFTGGYNDSLQQIDAEICVLLNSDVEVTENWLIPCVELLHGNPEIAACQPKILSYHKKDSFEYAGAAGGFIDSLAYPFCRGRIFNAIEDDRGQYDDEMQVFWASGACLFLKKNIFLEMGGFDEDFFAHMEEIDLCWRIQNAGLKVYYNGNSHVYHVGGGTLSVSNPRKTYYNFRNGLTMMAKNDSTGNLWWKLPFRVILDMVAAFKFVITGSWKDGFAVIKAHSYFWFRLGTILRKRKQSRKYRKSTDYDLRIYKGFIVFDYFINGKRKFYELKSNF